MSRLSCYLGEGAGSRTSRAEKHWMHRKGQKNGSDLCRDNEQLTSKQPYVAPDHSIIQDGVLNSAHKCALIRSLASRSEHLRNFRNQERRSVFQEGVRRWRYEWKSWARWGPGPGVCCSGWAGAAVGAWGGEGHWGNPSGVRTVFLKSRLEKEKQGWSPFITLIRIFSLHGGSFMTLFS